VSRKRKLLLFALIALEVVLFVSMAPTSIPHDRKTTALFAKWLKSRSEADKAAFRAEMGRVMAGQRKRQKIAGILFVANSAILIVVARRKDRIHEQPQQLKREQSNTNGSA